MNEIVGGFAGRVRDTQLPAVMDWRAWLADRSYVNEKAHLVSNGLSTELLCFPSDMDAKKQPLLREKIDSAIEYATSFRDMGVLNLLLKMQPNQYNPSYYATLGLFLYFEDLCSQLRTHKTFLTAMREEGAERDPQTPVNREAYYEKTLHVIQKLGMGESAQRVLKEWYEHGSYTIHNDKHYVEGRELHGTYTRLASRISNLQDLLGINLCISYALANQAYIQGNPRGGYDRARYFLNGDKQELKWQVQVGNDIRAWRVNEKIHETFSESPVPHFSGPIALESILSQVPDETVELLCRRGYVLAYADRSTIDSIYPGEMGTALPGMKAKDCDVTRVSTASRLSRYRTIFLSNGRQRLDAMGQPVEEEPRIKSVRVAQSLIHETGHLIYGYLYSGKGEENRKTLNRLEDLVWDVHRALEKAVPPEMQQHSKILWQNTIAETVDLTSPLYGMYDSPPADTDTRVEEVICNLYGLMHTEFAGEGSILRNPPPGLECLKELAEEVDRVAKLALERCRKEHPDLPGQRQPSSVASSVSSSRR